MASLKSWVSVPTGSSFSIANIPFGIISTANTPEHRPAIAIGEHALDLLAFAKQGGFGGLGKRKDDVARAFASPTLNAFAALGRPTHRAVRQYLQDILSENTRHPEILKDNKPLQAAALIPQREVQNHLPLTIGDYTDFFAGRNHASNVGTLFRGAQNALNPNYNHIPVAYHGRASSVVVSGTPLHRPWGQIIENPAAETKVPIFSPSRRLDIELELGMFVTKENGLGQPVPVQEAEQHIFGYVLMNDWSARDIQVWEYVPLGPFNAKNFGTTISPWVVLADALEPFRAAGLENPIELLPYLSESRQAGVHDIRLEVELKTSAGDVTTISRTNSKYLVWSWPQMIAHHSVGGCNLRVGDLFGSGTISGTERGSYGSFLEQSQGGKQVIPLTGGGERKFVQDNDTVIIRGLAGDEVSGLVGFGECVTRILPAIQRS